MSPSTGLRTGLVLASASAIRREMLEAAGVAFAVRPADLDEEAVKAGHSGGAGELALKLAEAKTLAVSGPELLAAQPRHSRESGNLDESWRELGTSASQSRGPRFRGDDDGGALVLGADSVVEAPDGRLLSKPATLDDARAQLLSLRGATHRIVSAAALARGGTVVWRGLEEARMTVRPFSDAWLEDYLAREWEHIRWTVGGYRFEALGAQLFARVEGSYHAVLGLPLLPLLGALRAEGALAG